MPDPQSQGRRPDAIRCPRDYPFNRQDPRRDIERNRQFGPLLGVPRVWNRELIDRADESFVTPTPEGTLLYPHGHPRAKEHRYAWFVAARDDVGKMVPGLPEEGVAGEAGRIKLGYLLPDEHAENPEVAARVAEEYDRRLAESMSSPERLEAMRAAGVITDDEHAAMSAKQTAADLDRPPTAPPRTLAQSQEPGGPTT